MQKIRPIFSLLAAFVLLSTATDAQKKKYEFAHNKNVSQTYPASSGDKLNIDNQFGDVVIKTWNRNEVKVDISVEVSSTIKEDADEMFNRIDIRHSKSGNNISFKTDMEDKKDRDNDKRDRYNKNDKQDHSNQIDIHYEVSMPSNLALDLKNRFGKSVVPDLTGKVDIDEQFGDLDAGRLTNPGKITVKFGSANIDGLNDADVDLQFINNVATLKNITGTLDLNANFCQKNGVVIYTNSINSLNVKANYSDVVLVVPKDVSANFNIKTQWGSLKNNTAFNISKENEEDNNSKYYGPRFSNSYKGSAGGGKNKYTLKGNFSDFIIGHDAPALKDYKKKTASL
ncbi:MAG: hypothetical protein JWN76_840 [Chitinophagaceae bacterium]|nr:hypothetical protein [Chitinophagaceae bacterium]